MSEHLKYKLPRTHVHLTTHDWLFAY